jgi:3D (Asp-Asp-Asp) domain-containing protein
MLLVILAFLFQDTVTVTTYKLTPHDQGKWGTKMASGYKVNVKHPGSDRVVAVSRDLLKKYPFGTFIEVKGKGVWQVQDVMAPRFKKRVDLLIDYKTKHNKFTNVIITKYEHFSTIKISHRRSTSIHRLPSVSNRKHIKKHHHRIKKSRLRSSRQLVQHKHRVRKISNNSRKFKRRRSESSK